MLILMTIDEFGLHLWQRFNSVAKSRCMLQKRIGAKQLEAFPFQLPDAFRFTGLCSCILQAFAVLFLDLFNPGSERVAVDAELVSRAFDVVWLGG